MERDRCCRRFRGIRATVYLKWNGTIEKAKKMANHEAAKTTKVYDRRDDEIPLDEVERITD